MTARSETDTPRERGFVRIGFLRPLPQLLREFALDPVEQLVPLGVHPDDLERDDRQLAYRDAVSIVEHCSRAADCPHFGLLAGARFDPATFGETAVLMLECPTVGAALATFILRHHLLDCGAVAAIEQGATRTTISYCIYTELRKGHDLALDMAIAIGARMVQMLCGKSWRPLHVTLAHRPPCDTGPYHQVFGHSLDFNAHSSSFVFPSFWLDQPVVQDPMLQTRLLAAARQEQRQAEPSFAFMVRRTLRPLLSTGRGNLANAARLFSMHPKAFVRRLGAEGLLFKDLLAEARHSMAVELLSNTDLPMGKIAASLQYAHPSAFTRAFRTRAGGSPSEWRARSVLTGR